jgi:Amt family ammonium transporter
MILGVMDNLTLSSVLINNLWVVIAALFVFIMTIAVGVLEIGELGTEYKKSLLKTIVISGTAIFVMAIIGFNTAFAPTIDGIIGNPFYGNGFLLGGFSYGSITAPWWSMTREYFNTGLYIGTYYLFETAFAAVTLALVGVIVLKKMKFKAFFIFSIVYFVIIWNLPAAWIWNPTGWLYEMGMRDFAGGLVVHGAAAAAGLALVYEIWREEKKKGLKESMKIHTYVNSTWLALGILLLWIGWFGFNPGSVLEFNSDVLIVVVTTFVASGAAMISTMLFRELFDRKIPVIMDATNGILMGLIIITPLAGFVSPASALILGLIGGPLFIGGEKLFARVKWFSDPVGLFPGHGLGGVFGVVMIAFFTQHSFAVASGNSVLPNGLLFYGGFAALRQLGIELLGIAVVVVTVFIISLATIYVISKLFHGILNNEIYDTK